MRNPRTSRLKSGYPFVQTLLDLLNQQLGKQPYGTKPAELYEPIRYMMSLGGKRLRPVLTLLGAQLFTDDVEPAVLPALAVEVFHNFTLMHDDIMDQAPLRRGKPTVHAKWSPTTAILSGDVMLVRAYELLLNVPDKKLRQVMQLFSRCAAEVCEGQQLDMNFETRTEVSIAEYLEMIRLKTAVLLGFSLQLGALIGGASDEAADHLRLFGTEIGLAFQLQDDLLDVYADKDKFGKQVGGDIRSNKKTFLLLSALEKADAEQHEALLRWLQAPEALADEKVTAVTALYDALGVWELTEEQMETHYQEALAHLDAVDAPAERKARLRTYAETLMDREH
jgi:geranylgeranyl diphosphate synthase type II